MLCLHQTIAIGKGEPVGLGGKESLHYALHLVKRGYVCLAPDYPSFGDYPYDFKAAFRRGDYQSGTMKAIWNNMRAGRLSAIAAGSGWRADRRHRPLARRAQRDVHRRVRRAAQGDRVELRILLVRQVLRR